MCWSGRVCFGFPIRGGCVDMPTGAGCFPLVSVHVSVWLRRVLCFCLGVAVVSVVPDWLVCSGLGLAFVGTSGKALGGYVVAAGRCGCDPGGDGYNCGGGAFSHILPCGLIPCIVDPDSAGGVGRRRAFLDRACWPMSPPSRPRPLGLGPGRPSPPQPTPAQPTLSRPSPGRVAQPGPDSCCRARGGWGGEGGGVRVKCEKNVKKIGRPPGGFWDAPKSVKKMRGEI